MHQLNVARGAARAVLQFFAALAVAFGSLLGPQPLAVPLIPQISQQFGAQSVPLFGETSLTFTVTNPSPTTAITGVQFSENLPAGLLMDFSTMMFPQTTCLAGLSTSGQNINLQSFTLGGGVVCTVTIPLVQGITAGLQNNSVTITSDNGSSPPANASLLVVAPPLVEISFGTAQMPVSGTTSLNFAIANNNATAALTGIGFTDTLPAGLVVANPTGATGACAGAGLVAMPGATSISLTGAGVAAAAVCHLSINVTGTTVGVKNNQTSEISSVEGGTGAVSNIASVTVVGTLDIDGSGAPSQYDALTDGLLTLRYLFGLTGPALTNGAIGGTATRTTPAAVQAYLDAIRSQLDIDGDGNEDALTDGLLIIRYLFGLRGNALIQGAIGAAATRTTSAPIESVLGALTP